MRHRVIGSAPGNRTTRRQTRLI